MEQERREDEAVKNEGRLAAYIIGGVLLAATFWASPWMGVMFATALVICAAVCAAILGIAYAISGAETVVNRMSEESARAARAPRPTISRTVRA